MIGRILDFRLRQFGRILKEIGAGYFILLALVCFGFFMGIVETLVKNDSIWMGLVGAMIAASIHFSRKDLFFLKQLGISSKKLFFLEYLLLNIPLIAALVFGGNYLGVLILFISVFILSLIPTPEIEGKSFANSMDFNWLPGKVFEAKSYLRKFVFPLALVYLIGLLTAKFIAAPIVLILILALTFTGFFEEIENKDLFESMHFTGGILFNKCKQYLSLYLFLSLPFILLFLFFNMQYWYILLAALFIGSTLILFNIVYKYAHYSPYRKRVYNSTVNGIFIVFAIVPFTYPVTLLYLIYYWRKASINLKRYYA